MIWIILDTILRPERSGWWVRVMFKPTLKRRVDGSTPNTTDRIANGCVEMLLYVFFSVNYMIYKHISEGHMLIAHFSFHLLQCDTLFPWYLRDIPMICGVRNVLSLILKCCLVIPARSSKAFHQPRRKGPSTVDCAPGRFWKNSPDFSSLRRILWNNDLVGGYWNMNFIVIYSRIVVDE